MPECAECGFADPVLEYLTTCPNCFWSLSGDDEPADGNDDRSDDA